MHDLEYKRLEEDLQVGVLEGGIGYSSVHVMKSIGSACNANGHDNKVGGYTNPLHAQHQAKWDPGIVVLLPHWTCPLMYHQRVEEVQHGRNILISTCL